MCWNVFVTVVVPAPEDPVTAMTGCLADMFAPRRSGAAEERPDVEERVRVGLDAAGVMLRVIADQALDLAPRSEDDRDPLVQGAGLDFEQPGAARRGGSAGLLHDHRHRRGLVEQAQAAGTRRLLRVARIHEQAAADQDPMHLRDERGDPAHVEIRFARAAAPLKALLDIDAHGRFPEALVRGVDRELARLLGDAEVSMGEDELTDRRVEREPVDPVAQREHQHGRRPVECVPRTDLSRARLEEGVQAGSAVARRPPQDGEDGADGDVHVEIRGAVERVEDEEVLAARMAEGNGMRRIHLLGHHPGEMPSPFAGGDEDLVGEEVEVLLPLALAVLGTRIAERARKRAARRKHGDFLDGGRDVEEQPAQAASQAGRLPVVVDEEPRKGGAVLHADPSPCAKTLLARRSSASIVMRSSRVAAPVRPNSLFAWRSRARSSALRMERALAKRGCRLRSAMYSRIASRAAGLSAYFMPPAIRSAIASSSVGA